MSKVQIPYEIFISFKNNDENRKPTAVLRSVHIGIYIINQQP